MGIDPITDLGNLPGLVLIGTSPGVGVDGLYIVGEATTARSGRSKRSLLPSPGSTRGYKILSAFHRAASAGGRPCPQQTSREPCSAPSKRRARAHNDRSPLSGCVDHGARARTSWTGRGSSLPLPVLQFFSRRGPCRSSKYPPQSPGDSRHAVHGLTGDRGLWGFVARPLGITNALRIRRTDYPNSSPGLSHSIVPAHS